MKLILLTATMFGSAFAFGAANDTILTFSTKGPDTYGDGSTVLDGERYALVWVKDGTAFAGLTADCQPLAETTKIVAVAPLAQGGKCPETVFEIDADYANEFAGGSFALYLLDTRVEAGKLASASRRDADGTAELPTSVNAAGIAVDGNATLNSSLSTLNSASAVSLAEVGVYTKIEEPTITAMKVEGAKIELTVSGMSGAADYMVVQGAEPGKVGAKMATTVVGDKLVVDKPAGGSTFFKVLGARKFR